MATLNEVQCVHVRTLLFEELHETAKILAEQAADAAEGNASCENIAGDDALGTWRNRLQVTAAARHDRLVCRDGHGHDRRARAQAAGGVQIAIHDEAGRRAVLFAIWTRAATGIGECFEAPGVSVTKEVTLLTATLLDVEEAKLGDSRRPLLALNVH